MNGELAEVVALVAHGNAWLAGSVSRETDVDHFEGTNSTFQYVRSVSFEIRKRRKTHNALSVAEWLRYLADVRVDRLSLAAGGSVPVAFANQGLWSVLGHSSRRVYAWHGRWEGNRADVDPNDLRARIWEVTYRVMMRKRAVPPLVPDIVASSQALRDALHQAIEFARDDSFLTSFVSWFEEALALSASDDPAMKWHPDLLPSAGYGLDARRLMATATRAWVFGGMGSWNDIGFSDTDTRERYTQISNRLYEAVIGGIRDATNSFATIR